MEATQDLRVALVHDWLTGMRGGEKCLEGLCRRWPQAPLFTLFHRPGSVSPAITDRPVFTSWLQHLPAVDHYYRYLLPVLPLAASWHLPPCDLVVSLSHCVAKAVRPPRGVPHVCYCFTPMRYAWHLQDAYFGRARGGSLKSWARDCLLRALRAWDQATAERVTHFVAISRTVQRRIRECYGRSSDVIYPPVDTDFYCPAPVRRNDHYLVVSAFSPYKRLDLAIAACNQLRRPLLIIGSGPEGRRLRRLAGPTVRFLGWQPDRSIRDHLRRCRALLFPGEEDFGIVPAEAQACGAPVIAYGRGGATETVIPPGGGVEPTGIWFEDQTTDCLIEGMRQFEATAGRFQPAAARRNALRFNARRFADEFFGYVAQTVHPPPQPSRRAA
jgi:glycosyltransferase involved in cell wall biosynthesis